MEEFWDDDGGSTATTTYESKPSLYVPPSKRWNDNTRDSAWNSSGNGQYSSRNNREDRFGGNGYQGSGRGGRGQHSFEHDDRNGSWRSNDEESTEFEIESNYVGRVIGKGGAKIQELQQESGAHIKVMKEGNASIGFTIIRLSGSNESRDKAKTMIEELTSDFSRMSTNRDFSSNTYSSPSNNYSSSSNNYSASSNNYSSASNNYSSSNSFYDSNTSSSNSYYNSGSNKPLTGKAKYGYSEDDDQPIIDWDNLHRAEEEHRKKRLASLPPIRKAFYSEDPAVSAMSKKQVADFRAANNSISISKVDPNDDRAIPNPVTSFAEAFQHYPELLKELAKQGFKTPSPIQSQAWPVVLSGYDLIGIAQTGTGKTIAFLFPAMIHIVGQVTPRHKRTGPTVVVMAPTRELAQQIEVEAKKYTYHGITSVCIYGGGSRRNQISVATKGVDIVIATPGRLNDLVMNKVIDVTGVSYLVLDEADRMLDMGFEPQIRKIVLDIRPDRQTIMTSATWTSEIQEMASRYMDKPFKVNVGALDLAAVHSVTQEIIFAADEERRDLLRDFLDSMGPEDKVIVFVERKSVADDLSSDLLLQGVECQSIHGDREQVDREQALTDLKTGVVRILVATDVASRGLDIKDITHIFNMYFPHNIEEYVHRVGRTGRAGRTGTAISIFTRQDWMHAESFIKILEEANQFVPDELYEMADRYRAWKRKKDAEDAACGGRPRRGGGRGRRY